MPRKGGHLTRGQSHRADWGWTHARITSGWLSCSRIVADSTGPVGMWSPLAQPNDWWSQVPLFRRKAVCTQFAIPANAPILAAMINVAAQKEAM